MPSQDAALLTSLASELHEQPDEAQTVRTIVSRTAELVPDADHVTLVVRVRHRLTTVAWSSLVAAELDDLQQGLDEGPSVDVFAGREVVRSGDIGRELRWPQWGPRAQDAGGRSVCSVRLPGPDGVLAALTMYAGNNGRFADPERIELATLYGHHAGHALGAMRQKRNLETALETRHAIGVAQGLLMERFGMDLDHSFDLLRRLSSSQNRKLNDVAREIVATGRVPGLPTERRRAHLR